MRLAFHATVRRLREWTLRRTGLFVAAFVVSIALESAFHSRIPWLLFIGLGVPGAIRDGARRRSVVASADGLKIDDALLVRDQLVNAFPYADAGRRWLRVELADGAVEIEVPKEERAHEITRAIGLEDAAFEMRVLRARDSTSWYVAVAILGGVLMLYTAAVSGHFGLFLSALVAVLVVGGPLDKQLRRVTITAGIDGLGITRPRHEEVVPYDRVTRARAVRRTVILVLAGRGERRFDTLALGAARASARASTMVERIERARRRCIEASNPGSLLEAGAGAFRRAHLPADALWDALRNGKTSTRQRVLLAATLRQQANAEDLTRLREAAAGCAPPARRALRRVLDAPDDELDRVVEELASITPR